MMAGVHLLSVLVFSILGLTVAGQEAAELLSIHEPTGHLELRPRLHRAHPPAAAVSVGAADLPAVSFSVPQAETWLRGHVLSRFPPTEVSTIVVGRGVVCGAESNWRLVLPALEKLYDSLVRWGLEREIRVSAAFSTDCLVCDSLICRFRDDLAASRLRPLLSFLQRSSSTYLVDPSPRSSPSWEDAFPLFFGHRAALEKLGFSQLKDVWLMKEEKPEHTSRRLSSLISSPYPEKPKQRGFPSPGHGGEIPNPPSPLFASAPDGSFSFVPVASPSELPDNPPNAFSAPPPPCVAAPATAPVPHVAPAPRAEDGEMGGLWCVAKPTVPPDTLQEAMDYACGEGGADCEEIKPHGNCYYPDNVVAHASYAFNNYWQKTKKSGGSCNFEGTAVLINSDPSFLQCRFVLG